MKQFWVRMLSILCVATLLCLGLTACGEDQKGDETLDGVGENDNVVNTDDLLDGLE